jgi:hypothetical protein
MVGYTVSILTLLDFVDGNLKNIFSFFNLLKRTDQTRAGMGGK